MLDRRKLLVGATALASYSALARAAAPYEWQTISPADAGFVPGFGEQLDQFVRGGQAPNIHGVIIVRRGRVVFENYSRATIRCGTNTAERILNVSRSRPSAATSCAP